MTSTLRDYFFYEVGRIHDRVFKVTNEPDSIVWGEYVYSVLFGTEDFTVIDEDTFPIYALNSINVYSIAGYRPISHYKILSGFTIRFTKARLWPRFKRIGDLATIPPRPGPLHVVLLDHPVWYEFRNAVKSYDEAVQEHVSQRNRFIVDIDKICTHYPTVNEALAAWPALRGLLPDEWQQLDLEFDGTPKALPDGVDIVELTALITRAKLTGV